MWVMITAAVRLPRQPAISDRGPWRSRKPAFGPANWSERVCFSGAVAAPGAAREEKETEVAVLDGGLVLPDEDGAADFDGSFLRRSIAGWLKTYRSLAIVE